MLKPVKKAKGPVQGGRFAIIASKYNAKYVDAMVRAAKADLGRVSGAEITVVRVPGAYEIPVVAAKLASQREAAYDAIICLGVILRGATTHAEHIGLAVSHALAQVQIRHLVPIIHEVLLFENEQQAVERCLSKTHNRGSEAAQTAMEMARVLKSLNRNR